MTDELDDLIDQMDYLERRVRVPSDSPYAETVKESLEESCGEKDLDTLLKEFNQDLEGMLESIGSYRDVLINASKNI